jgi:hypothetical protein
LDSSTDYPVNVAELLLLPSTEHTAERSTVPKKTDENERDYVHTLTADWELSPQLSQRTPPKSNAYKSPIAMLLPNFVMPISIAQGVHGKTHSSPHWLSEQRLVPTKLL